MKVIKLSCRFLSKNGYISFEFVLIRNQTGLLKIIVNIFSKAINLKIYFS